MNKKLWLLLMTLVLALALAACGGGEVTETAVPEVAPTEAAAPTEAPAVAPTEEAVSDVSAEADTSGIEAIRIAIVMPSTVTDLAWSQSMYDALVRIQEQAGGPDVVEIAYTENMFNVTDAASAIRDYADNGYNLVIAHGTQYGTSLFEIAPDFPETSFAWGTAVDYGADLGLTNVFAYEARAEEGGFVNGVLAANLSKSGILGVVGPVEAGDAKLYIDGFVAGAKSANPDIQVNVSYTGSFGDTALAAEAANTHIAAGADVLTGSAQQVVGAIGVAKEQGVLWMGTQSDQSSLAPDIVVASQLYDWDGILTDMIKRNQAGEYGGAAYALTLANSGLVMKFADGLEATAVAAANEASAQIVAGSLDAMAAAEAAMPAEEPAAEEADMMEYPEIEPVRIALVMPSTTTDLAWSQSIYDSLILLQEHYGADVIEIAYTENMFNVTDAAAAIRDYADSGYNLILAHGAQYGTSLFEIAPDFPETSFAWGTTTNFGADEGVTNVFAYDPRLEQGGYVLGVLAANITESGIIGLVGPVDAGDAKLHVDGFVAGVRDTNPDAQVNVSFTGSFGDTALAAEAANTQIAAGADVLTGSAQQVVGAIGVAKEAGIPWMGVQADQSPLAPDIVVATVLYDWRATLLAMIQANQAGEYGGKVFQLTLENGGQTMIYADSLSADAVAAAQAAEAGIIDGSIEIVPEPRN
ncbi:MAG: BMP family protein [Chloroflexi bacterium]|nr:BMP family protein [Chloroflexota bacterium]MBP7043085.1 BMP family protein [Chloroflexota bacterium]